MQNSGWSPVELAAIIEAEVYGKSSTQHIAQLLTDSRRLTFPAETAFVALRSLKNDGHRYIPDLIKRGVRFFITDHLPEVQSEQIVFLVVSDTLRALQKLAAEWRSRFEFPVVGITGSNGKTVVKEWLYQVLMPQFSVVRSPRSYNSQIGVPLSLFQLRSTHEIALIEAGISQVGEMDKLEEMIHPDWGIMTNIGTAHQEHFESIQLKLDEKLKLFQHAKHLVFCDDQPLVSEAIRRLYSDKNLIAWSRYKESASVFLKSEKIKKGCVHWEVVWKGETYVWNVPLSDQASTENMMHSITFALEFGVSPEVIGEVVKGIEPVSMRLELKKARGNRSLINDTYNSDPESIRIALDFLAQQNQHPRKVVIMSDVEQSGVEELTFYKSLAEMLSERSVDFFIGVGPKMHEFKREFELPSAFYQSTSALISDLNLLPLQESCILIKGARSFEFEHIVNNLEEKVHQTVLEINLSALAHNLNHFRKLVKPETKLMAMVKAYAYGSGNAEIANILQFHKVDYLAVAYADEGVALRNAGITLPIMVMNADIEGFETMIEYHLEPEIFNFKSLQAFINTLHRMGKIGSPHPIHIKLDTGMHRLGFEEPDTTALLNVLLASPDVRVASVFSHLAASDDDSELEFTKGQIEQFIRIAEFLEQGLGYGVLRHILNSSGISNYLNYQGDMVRLGIGLYGISPVFSERPHLRPVSKLRTIISQIRTIQAGDSVSYGRTFVANRTMKIGTIAIGYADGFRRSLGNGVADVYVNGNRCPVIGRVCMDMCMIDLTDVDAQEGDEVEIFGEHISVYEIADKAQTIPYEILTGISSRVKRVYYQE